ncbi:MAG TPA: hypothetical protein DDX89_07255, partial [Candidatus Omnitrophica bacterium]|nr:hypothetical protein [Candidatus Omnitrophota bacterium]
LLAPPEFSYLYEDYGMVQDMERIGHAYHHGINQAVAVALLDRLVRNGNFPPSLPHSVLIAFLEAGAPVHGLFQTLYERGAYSPVVYNRAITVQARRQGYSAWQVGSILVVSYGILDQVPVDEPLPAPGGPVPTGVHVKLGPKPPDELGYQRASLTVGARQPEFYLFRPGYQEWVERVGSPSMPWQERLNRHEVFLFGVDLEGSRVFYLTPWGEVLAVCTLFGDFVQALAGRMAEADQYLSAHPTLQELWSRLQQEGDVTRSIQDHLLRGGSTAPEEWVEAMLELRTQDGVPIFRERKDAREFLRHGFTKYLVGRGAYFVYRLGVMRQFYGQDPTEEIAGHRQAIRQRFQQVAGVEAEETNLAPQLPPSYPIIDFAISEDTASKFLLRRGGFREALPARDLWDLLGLLETEGIIPTAEVPAPGPLSNEIGFTRPLLMQLDAAQNAGLELLVNGQPRKWKDLNKPFPDHATVILRLAQPSPRLTTPVTAAKVGLMSLLGVTWFFTSGFMNGTWWLALLGAFTVVAVAKTVAETSAPSHPQITWDAVQQTVALVRKEGVAVQFEGDQPGKQVRLTFAQQDQTLVTLAHEPWSGTDADVAEGLAVWLIQHAEVPLIVRWQFAKMVQIRAPDLLAKLLPPEALATFNLSILPAFPHLHPRDQEAVRLLAREFLPDGLGTARPRPMTEHLADAPGPPDLKERQRAAAMIAGT